ncbi:MAG: hypothetical protein IJH92_08625 [Mogibacterium sp.]|nr:hypothetical protein [Mogibacterium sp.]
MQRLKKALSITMILIMVLIMSGTMFSYSDISGYAATNGSTVNESTGGDQAGADIVETEKTNADADANSETDIGSSLLLQDIEAAVTVASAFENGTNGKPQHTDRFKAIANFWKSLTGKDPVPAANDKNAGTDTLSVTVTGMLPEGVTAEASVTELADASDKTKNQLAGDRKTAEAPIAAIDLTLRDGNGATYISQEPLTISIMGNKITEINKNGEAFLVYSYAENAAREAELTDAKGMSLYSADVLVYKDSIVNSELISYQPYDESKAYENGEDAVRFNEDADGLSVAEDAVQFEYNTSWNNTSANVQSSADQIDPQMHFILSSQTPAAKEKSIGKKGGSKSANASDTKTNSEKTITAEKKNKYRVSVTFNGDAGLPEDAELKVKELNFFRYHFYRSRAVRAVGADKLDFAYIFDVTIVDGKGNEYQPDENVDVKVELLDEDDAAGDLEVVHFDAERNPEVLESESEDAAVSFSTDGFSVYAVVGYTVDFHLGDYTYSIHGEDSIKLSELFEKLGINEIGTEDIEDVSFSDENWLKLRRLKRVMVQM